MVDVARGGYRRADPRLDHTDDFDISLAIGDANLDAIADPDLG